MATKPNLLFIFTDEQRFDTMACYGNTHVQTPNLNALTGRIKRWQERTEDTQPLPEP